MGFKWGQEQKKAFNLIKRKLTNASLLALPNFAKTFEIKYNASRINIKGVLMQQGCPIVYFGKN